VIEKRRMRYWTEIGLSSIYYVLNRLEKSGLVKSKRVESPDGKPARKTYSMTETGNEMIRRKIKQLLSTHVRAISPFDLGIAYSRALGKKELRGCLESYLDSLEKHLVRLNELHESAVKAGRPFPMIARYERHIEMTAAEKRWINNFMEKV